MVWRDFGDSTNCYFLCRRYKTFSISFFSAPPGPPSKPTPKNLGDVDVTLEWNPPEDDGGSPVVDYNLEFCLDGEKAWKPLQNNIVECEFTVDLEEAKVYRFRVTARNAVGLGKPSPVSDLISLGKYTYTVGCD